MAFKPSQSKKHKNVEKGELNMNSMMDMMTIILLFLLKSYSVEGSLVKQSENLRLPESMRDEKPKKELNVAVSQNVILVNDEPIMPVSQIDQDEMLIGPLAQKLVEYAEQEKQMEIEVAKEFTHQVIIQGDRKITFDILFKIMYTCSKSEFYKMRLLTIQGSGPPSD
jgi:biopolymer transport protein ExbD